MKTTYRISFNSSTWDKEFDTEQEMWDYVEGLSDTAARATVQKLINGIWHFWLDQREEWLPVDMTLVSMTLEVEVYLEKGHYVLDIPKNAVLQVPGMGKMHGVSISKPQSLTIRGTVKELELNDTRY